jgi:DNA-binding transcriptional regulator YiaG
MTPAELRAAIADLGMTQVGFARVAGVNPATVRRWLAGSRRIPGPIPALIAALKASDQNSSRLNRSIVNSR